MWEFRCGNTFAAAAFTSYGALWLSYYVLFRLTPTSALSGPSVGVYWVVWAIFTTYMFLSSLRTTGAVALTFFCLMVTLWCLGGGYSSLSGAAVTDGLIKIAGWTGLITAMVAWYTSCAGVMNATFGRTVLPVFPLR
jgi:succinate-acetate transporter protein